MKPALALVTAFILLLSACASLAADKPGHISSLSGIGPYKQITARILVMEPKHVWQAMMD